MTDHGGMKMQVETSNARPIERRYVHDCTEYFGKYTMISIFDLHFALPTTSQPCKSGSISLPRWAPGHEDRQHSHNPSSVALPPAARHSRAAG